MLYLNPHIYSDFADKTLAPCSKYSALDTHMLRKVDNDARIDPPIHVVYMRSGGAAILIFVSLGDN